MIYIDSITGRAYMNVGAWARALKNSNAWLIRNTQQEIINSINQREYICTPGFLMRRQIQSQFPKLLDGLGSAADLSNCGNVSWDEDFINALANILAGTTFEDYGGKILEARQWVDYLSDKTLCQRATAIKLIFALKMDEETASKFLISNDNNLLSARNPFDFICNFCLTCMPRISYKEAEKMLAEFECRRTDVQTEYKPPHEPTSGMTADMTNEITTLAQDDNIPADDKKAKLLTYMLEHEREFVCKVPKKNQRNVEEAQREMEYPSGFSFQNISKLKRLINYLAMLYPQEIILGDNDEAVSVPVETENGVAKVYDLTQAMYYMQDIELKDHLELNLPERGAALNAYNKIPFTHDVLLRLKNLSYTLRAIMRATTHPANAQDISRSTIMILAYFFITGYLYTDEVTARALVGQLKQDEKDVTDSNEKGLIEALREVTKNLDRISNSNKPIQIYIAALNWILMAFHFNEFYPPFVLDRFIMICLLADPLNAPIRDKYENSLQFLMQLVISESYIVN